MPVPLSTAPYEKSRSGNRQGNSPLRNIVLRMVTPVTIAKGSRERPASLWLFAYEAIKPHQRSVRCH